MSRDSGVADYFDSDDIREAHAAAGHTTGTANAYATGQKQIQSEWNSPQMLAAIQQQDNEYNQWLSSNPNLSKASSDPLGSFGEFLGSQQQAKIDHDTGIGNLIGSVVIAAGTAGIGSAVGGALGGGAVGAVGGGAASGATSGALNAKLQGTSIGKGALMGAIGGGIGGAASPLAKTLAQAGVNPTLASGLVKTGVGATTGAIGAGLSGQNVGAGLLGGATRGAINAGTSAVTGSIFNSGNAALPSQSPLAQNMSDDGLDYITPGGTYMNDMSGYGDPTFNPGAIYSGNNPGFDNLDVQGGGSTLGGGYSDASGNTTAGSLTGTALAKFLSGMGIGGVSGGGGNGSPAGGNSSILGSLAGLLTGSGGGMNGSLLAQLLGLGASGAGGALSSQAAKDAAGNFAGQTKYAPYNVTTANGSTQFGPGGVNSTPNSATANTLAQLNGVTGSAANALRAGPQAASDANFNSLTSGQLQAQQRLMGNTQDNEFANGVLGSTAGQYQTQGALGAIGSQISGDRVTANDMATQQQQQQLAQLTAGLNGTNQINAGQLVAAGLGGNLGSEASGANVAAYSPSLAANSNSNIGNLLTNMGGAATNSGSSNNNALQAYLTSIMQGHG